MRYDCHGRACHCSRRAYSSHHPQYFVTRKKHASQNPVSPHENKTAVYTAMKVSDSRHWVPFQLSPKSFHRNMEGTNSGCTLRACTFSSSSCNSSGEYTFFARPFEEAQITAEGLSLPVVGVSPDSSSPVWMHGLSNSRFFHRMAAYRTGMPTGYTCAAAPTKVRDNPTEGKRLAQDGPSYAN